MPEEGLGPPTFGLWFRSRTRHNTESPAKRRFRAFVAQIDTARKLTEAIWHMLTTNQPFTPAPGGSTYRLAA